MNSLLGRKVIALNSLNWDKPGVLEWCGMEKYVLSPEQVVAFGPSLELEDERRVNFDSRNEKSIQTLFRKLNDALIGGDECYEDVASKWEDYDNQPFYWFANPVVNNGKVEVALEMSCLIPQPDYIPLHQLGEKDKVPVIYYHPWRHASLNELEGKDESTLLKIMGQAGMTMPNQA